MKIKLIYVELTSDGWEGTGKEWDCRETKKNYIVDMDGFYRNARKDLIDVQSAFHCNEYKIAFRVWTFSDDYASTVAELKGKVVEYLERREKNILELKSGILKKLGG